VITRSAEILERLLDDLEEILDHASMYGNRNHPLLVLLGEHVDEARADWTRAKLLGAGDHHPSPRGDQSRPAPGP
jgi:hypothetical protein